MTLNDLEPSQKGFLVNFSQYLDAAHISILNCNEMAGVRPRQPAYEIFSIKRRFQQSKSRSPRFMQPGACGRQRLQRFRAAQVYIIHKVAPRYWRWWRGVVGNAFRLSSSPWCSHGRTGPLCTGCDRVNNRVTSLRFDDVIDCPRSRDGRCMDYTSSFVLIFVFSVI